MVFSDYDYSDYHKQISCWSKNKIIPSNLHVNTYIHTYFIGSSPRGFSESILHYKIVNQVLHYLCICKVFPGELSSKQQQ